MPHPDTPALAATVTVRTRHLTFVFDRARLSVADLRTPPMVHPGGTEAGPSSARHPDGALAVLSQARHRLPDGRELVTAVLTETPRDGARPARLLLVGVGDDATVSDLDALLADAGSAYDAKAYLDAASDVVDCGADDEIDALPLRATQ